VAVARRLQFNKKKVATLHVYNRTVRHAFLFRMDDRGREQYARKNMFLNRLKFLLSIFSVECLGYSIMDNVVALDNLIQFIVNQQMAF